METVQQAVAEPVLSDEVWDLVVPLMPRSEGRRGRPFRDHRTVVEAMLWRHRTQAAWRNLPPRFGPWQTAWKRYRRFLADGTWARLVTVLGEIAPEAVALVDDYQSVSAG